MYSFKYFYTTIFFLTMLLFISTCGVSKPGVVLSEEKIERYIKAYSSLRKQSPQILETMNQDPDNPETTGQEQFEIIQQIITEAGLEDYSEFVMLNGKIGAIFSIIQAESGMADFDNLQESSNQMLDESINELQQNLNDPDIPEETKEDIRATIKELESSKKELQENYSKNAKWANLVVDRVKSLSGFIASPEEIELVKKYEQRIMEAYVGFPLPYQP